MSNSRESYVKEKIIMFIAGISLAAVAYRFSLVGTFLNPVSLLLIVPVVLLPFVFKNAQFSYYFTPIEVKVKPYLPLGLIILGYFFCFVDMWKCGEMRISGKTSSHDLFLCKTVLSISEIGFLIFAVASLALFLKIWPQKVWAIIGILAFCIPLLFKLATLFV